MQNSHISNNYASMNFHLVVLGYYSENEKREKKE